MPVEADVRRGVTGQLPDQTRDELASLAALTGRSLQEYLLAKLVELARQPDAEVLIARVRPRKAASRSSLPRDRNGWPAIRWRLRA